MATYKLSFGFYIEMDALNYTLRRKYIGRSRDGQEKEATKTCGYFGNLESAVKEYLRLVQLENLKDETFSAEEFLNAIDKSNEVAVEKIIKRIGESEKKLSNGDRIRGMGDEEMAKFIESLWCNNLGLCEVCPYMNRNYKNGMRKNKPNEMIIEWLKQPVED